MASSRKPAGYWNDIKNQQQSLREAKPLFNINNTSDWLSVPSNRIKNSALRPLLGKYPSFFDAVKKLCPRIAWHHPGTWRKIHSNGWRKKEVQQLFLDFVKENCEVKEWNEVTGDMILECGGDGLLVLYPSVPCLLFSLGLIGEDETWRMVIKRIEDKFDVNSISSWCFLPKNDVCCFWM